MKTIPKLPEGYKGPIGPDVVYCEYDTGKVDFDHTEAVSQLIQNGELFVHPVYYNEKENDPANKSGVVLSVLCNDVFAWGCADCEPLPFDKIEELYSMVVEDPRHGATKWCCKQRNEKPQGPVQRWMKEQGAWTDFLEKLPENQYDELCKKNL